MLRPSYSITLDQTTLTEKTLGPFLAMEVRRSKSAGADEALLSLGRVPEVNPAPEATVAIEVGWDGSTEPIFTGTVESVESGIDRMKIDCLGSQVKLMRMRADRTFINQSAGQIVSALAGDAGVSTDTVEDGIDFPVYLMDSSVGFYEHCVRLARKCGFDLYTTDEGDLVFAAFSIASADHTFKFGEQILSASAERSVPLDVVAVVPESPASSGGDDTASWFVKDPSSHKGEAGGGAIQLILSDPYLRTKDSAEKAAKGRLYFSKRDSVTGTVELMGSPQVKLGQAVALEGVPKSGVDDVYQVMAVRHCLDPWQGFRTFVSLGGMP